MRLLFFLVLSTMVLFTHAAHGRVISLSAADAAPYSTPDGDGLADRIIREACRRAGVKVRILYAPSERSLVNADEGIVDGEYLRIAGLEKKYPNLVMVPESICEYEFTVFAKDSGVRVAGWESLRPWNVGYITGWKILEENVKDVKSLTRVKDDDALFALLRSDRADLIIFERLQGEAYLKRTKEKEIIPLNPPLARRAMYLYLNRKYSPLVPRMAEALRRMKQDGTVRWIMSSVQGTAR
ncbi:MAG: ABC transporter substrate-binding protein [Desulfuromonadales bacterium]|nr:MAG: ABC transporter substrate-binding protein [Desulfuromonadales bacterium]